MGLHELVRHKSDLPPPRPDPVDRPRFEYIDASGRQLEAVRVSRLFTIAEQTIAQAGENVLSEIRETMQHSVMRRMAEENLAPIAGTWQFRETNDISDPLALNRHYRVACWARPVFDWERERYQPTENHHRPIDTYPNHR